MRDGDGAVAATDCANVEQAIARVRDEVADTYPSFRLRRLDWPSICAEHEEKVLRAGADPLPAFQRWLAELQDGHTWAWRMDGNLPYALRVTPAGATFVRMRERSAGHEAGVRPGWRLIAIDESAVDAEDWLARTAAPSHSRPFLAGRRLLAGEAGVARVLTAVSPQGAVVAWEDYPTLLPADPFVDWRLLDAGIGYLRVEDWIADSGIGERIDHAFDELRGAETLILDLRGNPGGSLVLASRTRDRFLRESTPLGSIRYGVGGGAISEPYPLTAEPAPVEKRWPGRLIVLTDELTFSSSEDFLLGLQGLDHVTVVGRPSGGGSGRPRSLRLTRGVTLTVSTALTYDRKGRCVENAGIPVDVEVAGADDELLEAATAAAR